MDFDVASVDAALTTTRSVRLRLDLERPVPLQIIHDCIDIAEQAPTGGNQSSRRWIVVGDPAVKRKLADLYLESAGNWMIESRDRTVGTGHPNEKVMRSAAHLAEHFAEVPYIVIPTIIGVHDGSGRPGLFDSVLQAAWSFCVALRARGLGTAWTTAGLSRTDDVKAILGIPDHITEIAMFPVAWTRGTDFAKAPRRPSREITYLDGFARTWESGPSAPPRLADGPGTVVEIDIKAPTRDVWPIVTDIGFPAQFSDEFIGARWSDGVDGPAAGASFIGTNQHPAIGQWEVPCFVHHFDEGRAFGWCTSDPTNPGARWLFELESIAGAIRLRFSVILGPGRSGISAAIDAMPEKEPRILARRIAEHRANMQRVIEGVKAAVEGPAGT